YQLAALLRSVSAFETYRKVYRDAITSTRVAELLILQEKMPRSLAACMAAVVANLKDVRNAQSHDTERLAVELYAMLQSSPISAILEEGLHAFLTRFLASVDALGNGISRDFLIPIEPAPPDEGQTQSQTQTLGGMTQTQTQTA
ncbi:MAG TPA: hypothetical protein DCP94_05005, partial [Massilia timonae]|nr:hypothetical protein [Massilia timonae]